jgi:peroxiredoxin
MLLWGLLMTLQAAPPPSEGLRKGEFFPDFRLPNVEGGVGRLSDHRGRKLVILSFASW